MIDSCDKLVNVFLLATALCWSVLVLFTAADMVSWVPTGVLCALAQDKKACDALWCAAGSTECCPLPIHVILEDSNSWHSAGDLIPGGWKTPEEATPPTTMADSKEVPYVGKPTDFRKAFFSVASILLIWLLGIGILFADTRTRLFFVLCFFALSYAKGVHEAKIFYGQ